MIDVNVLRGSSVREDGVSGRILSVSLPWVRIAWEDEDSIIPREEALLRSDARVFDAIEIATLNEGWVKLGQLMGARTRGSRSVLAEMKELLEKSRHNPFSHQANLGPGPRGRKHTKANMWDCKCSKYKCTCKKKKNPNRGRMKPIKIDKAYKKTYNKDYRKWKK